MQSPFPNFIDGVCQFEQGFPVGDDDDRAFPFLGRERFANQLFALHIDLTRRFIEDEDFWLTQKSASQRDALALSTAQSMTTVTDLRRIEIGKEVGYELVCMRLLGRIDDLFFRGILGTVCDVVANGIIEEFCVLCNQCDPFPDIVQPHLFEIDTVKQHLAVDGIIEAAEEADDECRLATSIMSNDGDRRTEGDL